MSIILKWQEIESTPIGFCGEDIVTETADVPGGYLIRTFIRGNNGIGPPSIAFVPVRSENMGTTLRSQVLDGTHHDSGDEHVERQESENYGRVKLGR